MDIIRGALRRPITVVVIVLSVVLAGSAALTRIPRDIFPNLDVPVIYIAQPYAGMDAAQMEGFLTYRYEIQFLYVSGIEHIESKSVQGLALIKLQFYSGTDMANAMAETINQIQRAQRFMPKGSVPPFVIRFDAGSVPVGNLVFSSEIRSQTELQDFAVNRIRPMFSSMPGISAPPPFGGSERSIVIHLDPERLRAHNMSATEVVEGLLGALLTGFMALFFLQDWRSALVVVISIPLSILVAIMGLWLTNQTINLMTLGGLALSVGILVDEATVVIENIHTHQARGKPTARAVYDATKEALIPGLLAM